MTMRENEPGAESSAADLGAVAVVDQDGRATTLGEAWRDKTGVLAFIRHFG